MRKNNKHIKKEARRRSNKARKAQTEKKKLIKKHRPIVKSAVAAHVEPVCKYEGYKYDALPKKLDAVPVVDHKDKKLNKEDFILWKQVVCDRIQREVKVYGRNLHKRIRRKILNTQIMCSLDDWDFAQEILDDWDNISFLSIRWNIIKSRISDLKRSYGSSIPADLICDILVEIPVKPLPVEKVEDN